MDFWIWALIIGAPILAVLGWVFWLVVGWLAVKKAVQAATYQQNQLDQLLVTPCSLELLDVLREVLDLEIA